MKMADLTIQVQNGRIRLIKYEDQNADGLSVTISIDIAPDNTTEHTVMLSENDAELLEHIIMYLR